MTELTAVVYVVDDEFEVRKALTRSIEKKGYAVQAYNGALEFLADYEVGQPGCLVLDVRMPEMSGIELQEELNRLKITLPVIFISGHGDISMSVQAIKDGAFDFLEKPYPVDVLLNRISEGINRSLEQHSRNASEMAVRDSFGNLTSREQDVMRLLVAGAANTSNKEIARTLTISHRTVDSHRSRIMEKMRARSISELVDMAKICAIYSE